MSDEPTVCVEFTLGEAKVLKDAADRSYDSVAGCQRRAAALVRGEEKLGIAITRAGRSTGRKGGG